MMDKGYSKKRYYAYLKNSTFMVEFEGIDDLTIFIVKNHHKIIYYAKKRLKINLTFEKCRRNLGEQQNILESLRYFKIFRIILFF